MWRVYISTAITYLKKKNEFRLWKKLCLIRHLDPIRFCDPQRVHLQCVVWCLVNINGVCTKQLQLHRLDSTSQTSSFRIVLYQKRRIVPVFDGSRKKATSTNRTSHEALQRPIWNVCSCGLLPHRCAGRKRRILYILCTYPSHPPSSR